MRLFGFSETLIFPAMRPRMSSAVIVMFAVLACGLAQDCIKNDAEVTSTNRACGNPCVTAANCLRNRPCVCDGICGLSCIATSRINYCNEVPATTRVTLTYVNPDRTFDSVVNGACNEGYIFESGNATRKCQGDANWSGDPYVCALPSCQPPTHVVENAALSSGDVRDSYDIGDWIFYSCDYGYYRDGSNAILCLESGGWTAPDFICRPKTCPRPNIPNGYVEGTYEFGGRVTAKCNTGYELDGLPYMTCQGDQTWSGYERTCDKVQCPALNAPANGMTIGNRFEYQDEVRYRCNEGYVVEPAGTEVRRCQADKTWSGPQEITTCREINCGELKAYYKNFNDTSLIGGSQIGEDYSYGNIVFFRCDSGNTLEGSQSSRCSEEETWTEPVPKCKESTPPEWKQPEDLSSQSADNGTCSHAVDFTMAMPVAEDNSGKVLTSSSHNPGDTFPVGETLVTFTATDPSDNTATTTIKVTVIDGEAPTFTSPPLQDIELNTSAGECSAIVTAPPVVEAADNCETVTITSDHVSQKYAVKETLVTYTAEDKSGNTNNETQQKVTVVDNEPPVFQDEQIRVLQVDTGKLFATVPDLNLDVKDNCEGVTQKCKRTDQKTSTEFDIGDTSVTCTATDAHGNSVTQAYTIKVEDIPHFSFSNERSELSNQTYELPVAINRTGNVKQQDEVCFSLTDSTQNNCPELIGSLPNWDDHDKCQFSPKQCLTFKPQQTSQSTTIDMKQCVDWVQNNIKIYTTSEFFGCMEVKFEESREGSYGGNLKILYHYNKPPGSIGKLEWCLIVLIILACIVLILAIVAIIIICSIWILTLLIILACIVLILAIVAIIIISLIEISIMMIILACIVHIIVIVAIAILVYILGKKYKQKQAVHSEEKHLGVEIDEKKPLNGEDGSTSEKSSEIKSPSTTKNGAKNQTNPYVESPV